MAMLGEITEKHFFCVVDRIEWSLHDVQSILRKDGDSCVSRLFTFCNGSWQIEMTRIMKTTKIQCLGVRIIRKSVSSHKNYVYFTLFKTDSDGLEYVLLQYIFEADQGIWEQWRSFSLSARNFSWSRESEFHLKVVCSLECFECRSGVVESIPRLKEIQKSIMRKEGRDMLIDVKGTLINLRTEALIDRSPVFKAMFTHDMVERNTGIVTIDTCEPEDFYRLRDYFYFDELDIDSMGTAYSLYLFTDMYLVLGAKAKCIKYMLENLDLETFMDIVDLSLFYEDSELREGTYPFFVANWEAIKRTRHWRAFRRLNTDVANDFLTRVGS